MAAFCLFSALASASATRHSSTKPRSSTSTTMRGSKTWKVICRARLSNLTVRVPALGRRPSSSQRRLSVGLIARMSCISRGMIGRLSIPTIALRTTAKALSNSLSADFELPRFGQSNASFLGFFVIRLKWAERPEDQARRSLTALPQPNIRTPTLNHADDRVCGVKVVCSEGGTAFSTKSSRVDCSSR